MSADLKTFSIQEYEAIIGPEYLQRFLESFSCPVKNQEESFLKRKALQSARLSASQTYLVCDDKSGVLLGYYTLVLKTYSVKGNCLTSSNRRLISRFAEIDEAGNFNAAVYLIAQIGKNFAVDHGTQITGSDLLALAVDEFQSVRRRIGGKLVMVERENDRPKLLDFYRANGFKSWTTRSNAKDGIVYDQMFAVLGDA